MKYKLLVIVLSTSVIGAIAFLLLTRVFTESDRAIKTLLRAKTPHEERTAFTLVNVTATQYEVRFYDTSHVEIAPRQIRDKLEVVKWVHITWPDGKSVEIPVRDPQNIWTLLRE